MIDEQMGNLTKEEFVHVLRRQSTGFPRGSSKYRGVTLHKCGRWEARMGQFLGKKYSPPPSSISLLVLSLLYIHTQFLFSPNFTGMFIWVCLIPRSKPQGLFLFSLPSLSTKETRKEVAFDAVYSFYK